MLKSLPELEVLLEKEFKQRINNFDLEDITLIMKLFT
jgi:hypothetical protein